MSGYSFTEVMFAVVVLGIGFIMIAAMFPVAISQQQSTQQETNAAAIARAAASFFPTAVTNAMLPPTGTVAQPNRPMVKSIRNPQTPGNPALANEDLWNALKGNLVVAGDQRYGVVLMYRREGAPNPDPLTWQRRVQLIVIVTQVRNRSIYTSKDVYDTAVPPDGYNLQARWVEVDITDTAAAPQRITFTGGETASVAEGSYVVIADDNITTTPNQGAMNGFIYRVGSHVENDTWQLAPGNDFKAYDPDGPSGAGPPITSLNGARAFIVGRNTTATDNVYEGGAQDIAVYTTFIQVR